MSPPGLVHKAGTPLPSDVMFVLLNQAECFVYFALGKTNVLGKLDDGFKPELGFTDLTLNMHMHSRFFPREEVETSGLTVQPEGCHFSFNGCDCGKKHFRSLAG